MALVLGKDTKKNLRSYLLQETLLKIRREQRGNLKREVGQLRKAMALEGCSVIFRARFFA